MGRGSRDINTAALLLKDPAFLVSDFTTGLEQVRGSIVRFGSGSEQQTKEGANESRQLGRDKITQLG